MERLIWVTPLPFFFLEVIFHGKEIQRKLGWLSFALNLFLWLLSTTVWLGRDFEPI